MDIVERAKEYATLKHTGQLRKMNKEPFIIHPQDVAELAESTKDDEIIAAAWLHDVVEDTGTTLEEICSEFGNRIAGLVDEVTKKAEEQGSRTKREYYHEKVRHITSDALTLKLLDRLSNICSVVEDLANIDKPIYNKKEVIDFAKYYRQQTDFIFNGLEKDVQLTEFQKMALDCILFFTNELIPSSIVFHSK
jgi:(p)ppGpp synthase/HD superfamily hydrolase